MLPARRKVLIGYYVYRLLYTAAIHTKSLDSLYYNTPPTQIIHHYSEFEQPPARTNRFQKGLIF